MNVTCPYCGEPAELVGGDVIYPHRSDLHDRKFWRCAPCGAYVGTHRNSEDHDPLGRLANAELRRAKQRAHAAFDPLWRKKMKRDKCRKSVARGKGYAWLAGRLGIDRDDCHIGMFDVAMCKRVVEVCPSP